VADERGGFSQTTEGVVILAKVYIEKDAPYRNPKILAAAKDEVCTLRVMCNGSRDTTVWCHSPYLEHGKATGRKAHDCFGCFGCYYCHQWLDGLLGTWLSQDHRAVFLRAMLESWLILLRKKVLK
jgi:hypothetical protein